ncbi:hypothetical protein Btru_006190 [Bulinus truncatus]|nr:hypothetical protein Btru_006190 [Bulinus truncatus]
MKSNHLLICAGTFILCAFVVSAYDCHIEWWKCGTVTDLEHLKEKEAFCKNLKDVKHCQESVLARCNDAYFKSTRKIAMSLNVQCNNGVSGESIHDKPVVESIHATTDVESIHFDKPDVKSVHDKPDVISINKSVILN